MTNKPRTDAEKRKDLRAKIDAAEQRNEARGLAEQAKAAVQLAALEDVTPKAEETIPDIAERAAVESMAARRRSTSMFDIGLEAGTILSLDRDASVKCTVTGPWEVEFGGERLSLSKAALKAINALGFEWPAANGWAHWTFNGRALRDIVTDHLNSA